MVREQLEARGIESKAVLAAMRSVPREEFVPLALRDSAYEDGPLPLDSATISQPYVVAWMTELAALEAGDRVLEVGTGSGYQAAVLSEMGMYVYTVELDPELAFRARSRLESLGYSNIEFRYADGRRGWPEAAPFDAIVVTAASESIPELLTEQLAEGGRLVIPVGSPLGQSLVVAVRCGDELHQRDVGRVMFVPLVEA